MRDRTSYLYLAVIVAVIAGVGVGFLWPELGKDLKPWARASSPSSR